MKLNDIIKTNKIKTYGFSAFKELEVISNQSNQTGNEIIIATDSPAMMAERGIYDYYAPVIPRNSRFVTVDDVIAADLDLQHVQVMLYPAWDLVNGDKIVIVSRHQGTIDLLQDMYPDAPVLSCNVSAEDITGCHVIGTLPPHLIQYCQSYRAVSIKDFDYSKDGDLYGQELLDRIIIHDPIQVIINEV